MKKILIITISIFFLFGIWQSCQGVDLILEGQYPQIGTSTPTSQGLPGFIKYIYLFALGAVGIVALLAILIGAIMYVFSAGSPDKAKDAKDRIMSALLGILILLSAVLILRLINPELVDIGFSLPEIEGGNGTNNMCQCTQEVLSSINVPDGTGDNQAWCQQYIQNNCPSNANSCNFIRIFQNDYTGTWWCDWKAIWTAHFGPGSCSDCNTNSGVCIRYFNNTLLRPCSSPGTTCSAHCI